jgi:2-methylcitrate dehydratase PrpD
MIKVVPDDSLPRGVSCLMTLKTKSGAELKSQVDHPRGSIENPMSAEDMSNKAHMLGDDIVGRAAMDELIERVSNVEKLAGVSEVMQLTVPKAPVRAAIGGRHA